jgi:hypothetical protein
MVRSSMYNRGSGDEMITVRLIPRHETDAGLLVSVYLDQPKEEWIWLPKSRISYKDDFAMGETIDVAVPRWLYNKGGLD